MNVEAPCQVLGIRDILRKGYHPLVALRALLSDHVPTYPRAEDLRAIRYHLFVGRHSWRRLPSMSHALYELQRKLRGDGDDAARDGEALGALEQLDRLVRRQRGVVWAPPPQRFCFTAMSQVGDLDVAAALPWGIDMVFMPPEDHGGLLIDEAGGSEFEQGATELLRRLIEPAEMSEYDHFTEFRALPYPVDPVKPDAPKPSSMFKGKGVGLVSFLALIARFRNIRPAMPTAVIGGIDPLGMPAFRRSDDRRNARNLRAQRERFLDVPIEPVHPVRRCIQAVLEQDAEVELLVLPEENRRAVEGDAALQEDIKDAKAKLRYVATVRDLFTGDQLFCEPLYAPPLRRSRFLTDSLAEALRAWNPFSISG